MYIVAALFSGFLCSIVAGYKNRSAHLWFFAGALFPVVSLLFLLLMPSNASNESREGLRQVRACPFCAEKILAAAKVCKHCGSEVIPVLLKDCESTLEA